ncbi:MAG: glycerol-3-phosphate 1-O-acyltransferase PlsY [Lachnospiraceae bacterium]
MLIYRILALVIGYFCGIILIGYLYGKFKKSDITKVGSGNVGTTNTLRAFGVKAAVITLLGDAAKPIMAMLIVWLLFHNSQPEGVRLLMLYAGAGAILGHNYPFYMKNFKGGKGIACTSGLILAYCPIEVPLCLLLFVGIVALTRYVSLGSLAVSSAFLIQTILFGQIGLLDVTTEYKLEVYLITAAITLMAFYRHLENISRLIQGTENKITLKKNKEGAKA